MRRLRSSQKNDGVVLEVLPGQAWEYKEWHQPLYGTLGRGKSFILVGPSPARGMVLPFAGMGSDEAGEGTMYEKHLKQVHLSRLSPVMWGWKQGYPRKELGVPIQPAYGMGGYESVNPIGSPIWSNTWQQRAAGALKRVNPSAMDGCGCGAMGDWGFVSRAVHGSARIPISLGLGAVAGVVGAHFLKKNMLKGAAIGAASSIAGLLVWFNVLHLPYIVPLPDASEGVANANVSSGTTVSSQPEATE